MLIFRYLAKEVFSTLASLTTILLLIFMSNQFVHYLDRAVSGQIPAMLVMKLMMLELPTLLSLLLPLGFYVALLVAYGRMYAESEMTVLQACGYGPLQLLKHSFIMASMLALLVMVIMVWASPMIATERAKLLRATGIQTLIQTLVPGRFQSTSNGRQVFYVTRMSSDHHKAQDVFLARLLQKDEAPPQWEIIWADLAFAETDAKTNEDYIILQKGKDYQGIPGQANYRVAEFNQYKARLPHPSIELGGDIRTYPSADLWSAPSTDLRKKAEWQWRLSVPIMVLSLTLLAVPLSRVNPRAGKYAKLLPAIVVYILYANFMFVARGWLVSGKIPAYLGLWWLHGLVILLGLTLLYRNRVTSG